MARRQRESGWESGMRFGGQLADLAAPFIRAKELKDARAQQLQDQELRRSQQLEDREYNRNSQFEDLQRKFQMEQALGKLSGARFTPINPAQGGRPASIGALPVSPNDPQDLMVAAPGTFISPSEAMAGEEQRFSRESLLKRLANPAQPKIEGGLQFNPQVDEKGLTTGFKVSDVPVDVQISQEEIDNMSPEEAAELNLGGTEAPESVTKKTNLRELQQQMDLEKISSRSRLSGSAGGRPLTSGQRSELLIDATKAGLNIEDYTDESGNIDFDALSINVGEKGRPQEGIYSREQRSSVNQLSDRFQKDPYFKKAEAAQGALDIVLSGLAQENSAGDISAINQFQSGMVDPGATVREGDIELMRSAASLFARAKNYIPRLMQGGVIPPELRAEIKEMSEKIYAMRAKNANEITVKRFKGIAPKFGVNFDDIGRDFPSIEQMRNPASAIGGPHQGIGAKSGGGIQSLQGADAIKSAYQAGTITKEQARKMIEDIKGK